MPTTMEMFEDMINNLRNYMNVDFLQNILDNPVKIEKNLILLDQMVKLSNHLIEHDKEKKKSETSEKQWQETVFRLQDKFDKIRLDTILFLSKFLDMECEFCDLEANNDSIRIFIQKLINWKEE